MCRLLLSRLPDGVDVALILNPLLTLKKLLASICDELGVTYEAHPTSQKALVDALYRHLLAANAARRRTVLIVDEAQSLGVVALERLRLLTNLETETHKLLQVILIGQPELIELLGRKELLQLSQRITARYHLRPLDEAETHAYVRHRLELAGGSGEIFERKALRDVHRLSGGVPRLINTICDRALLGAYSERRDVVDRPTVRAAAREVLPATSFRRPVAWRLAAAAAVVLLAVGAGSAWLGGAPARFRPTAATTLTEDGAPASRVEVSAVGPGAPEAIPPPPPPALSELLQSGEWPADRASAFATIFARWRLEPRRWSDPCEAATSFGLGCVEGTGGWPRLRRFDLPAVLELKGPDGAPRWVALVALEAETASLASGARMVPVPPSEIEAVWKGRFEVLWQPPPLGARSVTPGSRGRSVTWLRQRLDAVDGQPGPAGSDTYDERLRARVLAFQRDQSLSADGIAGVETLARLGSLVDQRIPSLSRGGK
jgi:general secretion pathway protein A